MTKSFLKAIGLLAITIFLLIGCGDEKTTVTTVEKPTVIKKVETPKTVKIETHAAKKTASVVKKDFDLSDVFKDPAKIAPNGKYMIIIFNSGECPYCAKMGNDIYNNKKLKDELKNDFSTFLLDVQNNRIHKLLHEGKDMDVDTKTLIDIYSVRATPTLIFSDKKGKSIFVVPGYMPAKQFLVTLDFIKEQKWLGLDRKNGDVYKALKNYYIDHGIDVRKKKKSK
jgi:thioredoxin-related protein